MRGVWVCLLVAACGDNTTELDGARSGSRLKLRWFELEDGPQQWEARPGTAFRDGQVVNTEVFYDEKLGLMCSAELWTDGVTRCTPPFETTDGVHLFSDSSCTVRVSRTPDKLKFVGELEQQCDELRVARLYPVTHTTKLATVYLRELDGTCRPVSSDGAEIGVLGDAVSDSFATLVTTTSHDHERVQVRYHESEDGMRVPIGLQDELLGAAVLSQMYALPDRPAQAWYWTDADCSGEAVVRVQAGCPAPVSAYWWPNDWGRYSRVAERVAPSTVFWNDVDGCTAMPSEANDYYRIIDEQLPLADMVTAPEDMPGRRIQVVGASTGARFARTGLMFDTQFGDCGFYEFPDGVYRCAPLREGAAFYEELFSDAACQVAIELAWTGFVLNGYQSSTLLLDDYRHPGNVEIRDMSERYRGPIYSRLDQQQQCIPYNTGSDWRRVGRVVDWSELARAELVTD